MQYSVITISRTIGSRGNELGELLADNLGFRYVDEEILDRAAALAGVTPEEIARAEARPGLIARVVANVAGAAGGPRRRATGAGAPGYEQLIIDVIRESAAMDLVVIVAHGASIPLAGSPRLLRVLVTAGKETRVARVAADEGLTLDEARREVEKSDAARADFFHRFYNHSRELPTDYDVVVNTDVLPVEDACTALLTVIKGA